MLTGSVEATRLYASAPSSEYTPGSASLAGMTSKGSMMYLTHLHLGEKVAGDRIHVLVLDHVFSRKEPMRLRRFRGACRALAHRFFSTYPTAHGTA